MTRRLVALVCVLAALVGAGVGYALAASESENLAVARLGGAREGRRAGQQQGYRAGYRRAFKAAREATYKSSYRRALAKARKKAEPRAYANASKSEQASVPSAPEPVSDCPGVGHEPTITNVSVRFMTCGQAQGIIDNFGVIDSHFTVLGYSCDRVSGQELGGQWRCTKGQQALRFDFGD